MINLQKAQKSGYSQSVNGRFLSSRYHPQKEAQRILDMAVQKNHQLTNASEKTTAICLLGLFPLDILALVLTMENIACDLNNVFFFEGNNIELQHYQKALKNLFEQQISHFLAVKEKFSQKSQWKEKELMEKIGERIGDEQKLQEFLKKQNDDQIKNIVVIKSTYLREEKIKKTTEIIKLEKIKRQSEKKTTENWANVWKTNKKRNIRWWAKKEAWTNDFSALSIKKSTSAEHQKIFNPSLTWIKDFPAAKGTAIFVAAGPSVEKNWESLRFWSKKCPIYTLAGMAGTLLKNGVKIEAIIATDPGYYQSVHFDSLLRHAKKYRQKIPVIAPLSCCFLALKNYAASQAEWHREKSIFFYLDEWKDGEYIIQHLLNTPNFFGKKNPKKLIEYIASIYCTNDASVSLSALRILSLLSHQKIVTLGCDFSSNGFAYHCQGYAQEEYFFTRVDKFHSFENWLQKSYFFPQRAKKKHKKNQNEWTDQKWMIYQQHFSKLKEELKKKNHHLQDFEQFLTNKHQNENHTMTEKKYSQTNRTQNFSPHIVLALSQYFEKEMA